MKCSTKSQQTQRHSTHNTIDSFEQAVWSPLWHYNYSLRAFQAKFTDVSYRDPPCDVWDWTCVHDQKLHACRVPQRWIFMQLRGSLESQVICKTQKRQCNSFLPTLGSDPQPEKDTHVRSVLGLLVK